MALFKRGRVWWYQFYYQSRRYRESTRTKSKTLATDIERVARRDVEAAAFGIRRPRRAVLLSVGADDWIALKTPTWAAKTLSAVTLDVRHLKKHFGRLLVTDIRAQDIADYINARRRDKASDKTIRNEIGSLRSILKRDRVWAYLKDEGVTLPKVTTDDVGVALTNKEEATLLTACAASRSRSLVVVVTLALSTGLRLDELRLLRWNQIDFVNRALRVGKSKTDHGAGRPVPLNRRALATMRRWAKQFPDRKPTDYVFPSEQVGFSGDDEIPEVFDTDPTKPISTWKTAWTTARTAADVRCRFHDLRHTVVTRLLEAGQPFAVVADIMGWSPATAMRMMKRYGHIGNPARRQAMAALDRHRMNRK